MAGALAALLTALGVTAIGAAPACSNSSACDAPSSGKFGVSLQYAQTLPVAVVCDGGMIDASACGAAAHPLDGVRWSVNVSGGTGTVSTGSATWTCTALPPRSAPTTYADGSTQIGTGCYLALECGVQTVGSQLADVQLQILPSGATDALVLVHDIGPTCCTDEYTGRYTGP